MIDRLMPYSEYKDSGLPWLRSIPAHWDEQPGIAVFREKQEKNTGLRVKRVLSLSYGRIVIKPDDKLHGLVPDSFETYQIVNPGDIIIRSTDLQNDWNSLRVGLVRDRGIITSAYLCFENLGSFTPEFAFLLIHSYDLQKFFYGLGSGLRQNLGFGDFKRLPFPIPSPDEQSAIVRFLDHANGRIERAIQAKMKLISLLNEQKQAIIHRAVTRGLDAAGPIKPSGSPWLGDIPKHWEQQALWTLSKLRVERNPGNLPLLSVFLNRGVILYEEGGGQVHAPSLDLRNYQVVHVGDFVLNNQQAWRGSVGVSRHHGIISPAYIVLQLSKRLDSSYANYLMRCSAMVDQFVAASKGVGDIQRQVFWPFLRIVQVPVPKLDEQKQIAALIDSETMNLNRGITRLEREISLLREYRTRLVTDVVTGKLDVRAAARDLPTEATEPECTIPAEDLPEEADMEESRVMDKQSEIK